MFLDNTSFHSNEYTSHHKNLSFHRISDSYIFNTEVTKNKYIIPNIQGTQKQAIHKTESGDCQGLRQRGMEYGVTI